MKIVFITCLIVGVAFSASLFGEEANEAEVERLLQDDENAEVNNGLGKRGLIEFAEMIKCATGRPAWHYAFYGCWCGKGGKGEPVDDTDSCCKTHDECYNGLKDAGICGAFELYFKPYDYSDSGCGTVNATISCGNSTSCGDSLCRCDSAAANCFANSTFDKHFKFYPKFLC